MNILTRRLAIALCACLFAGATTAGAADFYQKRSLVSDNVIAVKAENIDPNLVNAWGIAFNPFGVVWVNDAGTGRSTLYDGDGKPQPLVVTVPPAKMGDTGNPTGIVFYGGPAFLISKGSVSAPARFLFASEDGGIAGWAPAIDPTNAVRVVDNGATGASYKGLALGAGGTGALLYAADFHNAKVDVFDAAFKPVVLPGTPFHDPYLPAGYAPFGMQAINGDIYVSYAKQDADRHDDVKGRGFGFINVFDPNGKLLHRLATRGALNAPWGMALAPASFGRFSNRLLVSNFGDGTINAFDIANGRWLGRLKGTDRRPIRIDGLWGIAFGNGLSKQPIDTLFFTAGPDDEKHGQYGRLDVVPGDDRDDRDAADTDY